MKYYKNDDVDVLNQKINFFVPDVKYRSPNFIDHRDFCLPTNNQRNQPNCVGYTVAAYLEVEYWRRFHIPKQFPANSIYKIGRRYKPDTMTGTKLEYCLNGMKEKEIYKGDILLFSSKDYKIDVVKYYCHRYGYFMSAFDITDEWYNLSWKDVIKEKSKPQHLGGHCVFCCGYCFDGMYIQNSWGYDGWGNYGYAIVPWNIVCRQFQYGAVIENFEFNIEKTEDLISNG